MRFACLAAFACLCVAVPCFEPPPAQAQGHSPAHACRGGCSACPRHRVCRKQCGCPPRMAPPHHIHIPCPPPHEEEQPREAQPEAPREAVPGVAPGVFVAPPQAGEIEGPSRGFELPGLSISLPEMTFSLPRIRLHGGKRYSRHTRMIMDRQAAPYVSNPHYATAYAAQRMALAQREAVPRERAAEPVEDEQPREAEPSCRADGGRAASPRDADVEQRLEHLESCFQQQMETLKSCVEELKNLRSRQPELLRPPRPPQASTGFPRHLNAQQTVHTQDPHGSDDERSASPSIPVPSDRFGSISPASYLSTVPRTLREDRPPTLYRLPPVE